MTPKKNRIRPDILLARARDVKVPASPRRVRAVLALCGDRYVSASRISEVLIRDYGLTLKLFRLMNSAFFSVQRKDLMSVRYMVVLLGLENLAKTAAKTLMLQTGKRVEIHRDLGLFFIAQGSLAARMAGVLADYLDLDQEKASVIAMFRNLGEVIASLTVPALVLSALKGATTYIIDEGRFKRCCGGFTPQTLGLQVSRSWNLPGLARVAICPSRFNLKTLEAREQVLMTLADLLRDLLQRGLSRNAASAKIRQCMKDMEKKLKISASTIDRALFTAVMDFSKEDSFFFQLLDSQGLFKRLLDE